MLYKNIEQHENLEFHKRIIKIMEPRIPYENRKNYENHKIPYKN